MKSLIRTTGSLFPAIPSLVDNFFEEDWLDASLTNWRTSGTTLPAVNVRETDDDFMIEVAAPGLKCEDFKVELHDHVLTISSHYVRHKENADDNYTRSEFSYQAFQRSFSLPESKVKADKISARYRDGILHVAIPKKEEVKLKLTREIKVE